MDVDIWSLRLWCRLATVDVVDEHAMEWNENVEYDVMNGGDCGDFAFDLGACDDDGDVKSDEEATKKKKKKRSNILLTGSPSTPTNAPALWPLSPPSYLLVLVDYLHSILLDR